MSGHRSEERSTPRVWTTTARWPPMSAGPGSARAPNVSHAYAHTGPPGHRSATRTRHRAVDHPSNEEPRMERGGISGQAPPTTHPLPGHRLPR
ncbi:hypothetical protein RHA1_ro09138 (plasmid) [Rhodococcus jostii RHA1]|uniref:Uncharacterized protein n=1 Tax=Rhodococcus jostii (strain RHA1) TaxID=101510 RepID=Q0RX05_RHOJR|nr:hypothetical protein RHA1_ro09138 [Rhodococcus jostii RHA1]